MINRVTLVGRLGADPEIRTLSSGAMVAKFSMATSESYKDRSGEWQEETQWHDVVVWRNLAERAQQYLTKGSLVYLDGKLTHRKWQDKEGNPRKTTEVVGAFFRILDSKRDGNDSGDTSSSAPAAGGGMESEEDLPF
ncbi:single-strand DNA-binding protein [Lewinella marina]|uniref:Single-stranded DNA-binding protein n=1 Tax=Neolewinella marina TaxID=438751 RepID=A0A2G0CBS2_9BACT|nr:single-stranded DNA-binding protein [Neolewinella marina]NJB87054.1 single-strand DNA-binding protein [Neolewinella marina]PHK97411.1 single-stranded DNA-binding protein [Neolewinella marina]